ncbi:MAG: hypothetical protein R6X33_09765, partial [Candidatus Brocadiia bacterium]
RRDLRCPFGCRKHHRRQSSNQRSAAYYRTAAGKRKKKRLNGRRQLEPGTADRPPQPALAPQVTLPSSPTSPPSQPSPPDQHPSLPASGATLEAELRLDGVVLRESSLARSPMLPYVRMVVSLIDGVELTCGDVVRLLRRTMRQHSFGASGRIDYLLGFLHRHPP